MTPIIPESPSPQLKCVLQWFEGHTRGVEVFGAPMLEDYTHQILPVSIEMEEWGKDEVLVNLTQLTNTLRNFTFTIHDIIETPDKIFVDSSSTATSLTGERWFNQYFCTFRLKKDDDGEWKISESRAFIDAQYVIDFFPAEMARAKELGIMPQ